MVFYKNCGRTHYYALLASFLIAFTFCSSFASKGLPANIDDHGMHLLKNYHSSEYRGESQNWSVAQDERGLIYIANLDGVFEFDGVSWRLIRLPGNVYATSLALGDDGLIYVGSHSQFGYLDSDEKGRTKYVSLLDKFPDEEKSFSFIWDMFTTTNGLYFYTYEKLFRYHKDTITAMDKPIYSGCFEVNNNVYVFNSEDNQLLIANGGKTEVLVDFNELYNGRRFFISDALPYDNNQILYLCNLNGFFTASDIANFKEEKFEPEFFKDQKTSKYLIENEVSAGVLLSNGDYAFPTTKAGAVIIDSKGNIVNSINTNNGLQNETVNFILEDNYHNLWLALDNGVSIVNISLPITFFDHSMGFSGTVLDINRYKGNIHINTWQGVYKLNSKKNNTYVPKLKNFEKVSGRAWKLLKIQDKDGNDKHLYAATSSGIYNISTNNAKYVIPGSYYSIARSPDKPNIIIAGGNNGIVLIHYDENTGNLTAIKRIPDFRNMEVYNILVGNDLRFWVAHREKGISSICLIDEENAGNNDGLTYIPQLNIYYKTIHYDYKDGLPDNSMIEPFMFAEKVFFKTDSGFYNSFDCPEDSVSDLCFKDFSKLWKLTFGKTISLGYFAADESNNFWLQATNNNSREKFLLYGENINNDFKIHPIPFNPIKHSGINRIYFEEEQNSKVVWFAGDDAIVRYDISSDIPDTPDFSAIIRKIRINNSYTYYYGNNEKRNNENELNYISLNDLADFSVFEPSENTISFEYAAPIFHSADEVLYSTYLENYDEKWSKWNNNTSISYSNLPSGKYTFYVVAKDLFGNESKLSSFSFIIERPWYMQTWMFIIYLALLGFFIFYVTRLTNKRLVAAKANLEKLVKERTSEIAKQRQLIEVEKEKSDMLLRNILPLKIGQELKTSGVVKAQYYDAVTVMFMDFKDFSKIAQYINPFHLISELDKTFGYFDEICIKHGLEKIKTMGDAYLCAGGIPQPNKMHPFSAIFASFELLNFLRKAEKDQWLCDLRIGIHTGELIAGVIGKNKFTYDIWGETVNTAARMEASGVPGKINVSGDTYVHIKEYIDCTYRGKLPAKHKDEYDMYFATRIKKEYSADENGTIPNQKLIDELKNKFG